MPGPGSQPWGIDPSTGRRIVGKSALKRAKVNSRQGVTSTDTPPAAFNAPVIKPDAKKKSKGDDK